jgi:GNAT superfamily N-acetyltransferase
MRIRSAGVDDIADLTRLNLEVHAIHLAAMPGVYRPTSAAEVGEWFCGRLADAATVVLVADDSGGAVGYAMVRRIEWAGHIFALPRTMAEVDQIGVAASARRRGVGRALMAAAEEQARGWGVPTLVLSVVGFNEDALRFYRALGYDTMLTRLTRPL